MNNDTISCDEWMEDYRKRQTCTSALIMAFAYGVLMAGKLFAIAEFANTKYLFFCIVSFSVLFVLSYRRISGIFIYFIPVLVSVAGMVFFRDFKDVFFYFAQIGILVAWVFLVSGFRFKQAVVTVSVILLVTLYSVFIYNTEIVSVGYYLCFLIVLSVFGLFGAFYIEQTLVDLCVKTQEYQELSMTDELTELPSRAKFDFIIKSELERSRRYKYKFGLMMIEIDDFKLICDKFGREVRDDLLIVVSSMITEQVRSTDMEVRWSEHEFVVVCLELNMMQLKKIANAILQSMRDYDFGKLKRVTLSIGVTINKVSDNDVSIVNRAKQALLQAKHNKGNSVEGLE